MLEHDVSVVLTRSATAAVSRSMTTSTQGKNKRIILTQRIIRINR